jgi:hypothetical protein
MTNNREATGSLFNLEFICGFVGCIIAAGSQKYNIHLHITQFTQKYIAQNIIVAEFIPVVICIFIMFFYFIFSKYIKESENVGEKTYLIGYLFTVSAIFGLGVRIISWPTGSVTSSTLAVAGMFKLTTTIVGLLLMISDNKKDVYKNILENSIDSVAKKIDDVDIRKLENSIDSVVKKIDNIKIEELFEKKIKEILENRLKGIEKFLSELKSNLENVNILKNAETVNEKLESMKIDEILTNTGEIDRCIRTNMNAIRPMLETITRNNTELEITLGHLNSINTIAENLNNIINNIVLLNTNIERINDNELNEFNELRGIEHFANTFRNNLEQTSNLTNEEIRNITAETDRRIEIMLETFGHTILERANVEQLQNIIANLNTVITDYCTQANTFQVGNLGQNIQALERVIKDRRSAIECINTSEITSYSNNLLNNLNTLNNNLRNFPTQDKLESFNRIIANGNDINGQINELERCINDRQGQLNEIDIEALNQCLDELVQAIGRTQGEISQRNVSIFSQTLTACNENLVNFPIKAKLEKFKHFIENDILNDLEGKLKSLNDNIKNIEVENITSKINKINERIEILSSKIDTNKSDNSLLGRFFGRGQK